MHKYFKPFIFIKKIGRRLAQYIKKDAGNILSGIVTGLIVALILALLPTSLYLLAKGYEYLKSGKSGVPPVEAIPVTVGLQINDPNQNAYDDLKKLRNKMSLDKVTEIFGIPEINKSLPSQYAKGTFPDEIKKYTEWIYIKKKFVLQLISQQGQVVAYTIVRRTADFKPEIPYLQKPSQTSVAEDAYTVPNIQYYLLGELTYKELDEINPKREIFNANGDSKQHFYVEKLA